jgi:hypothetical protein
VKINGLPKVAQVLLYVDAIMRGDPAYQKLHKKALKANHKDPLILVDCLRFCGAMFIKSQNDMSVLKTTILTHVSSSGSASAVAARRDLGVALMMSEGEDSVLALIVQQCQDQSLTTIDRFFNLMDLLVTAGLVARDLNVRVIELIYKKP